VLQNFRIASAQFYGIILKIFEEDSHWEKTFWCFLREFQPLLLTIITTMGRTRPVCSHTLRGEVDSKAGRWKIHRPFSLLRRRCFYG